MLFLFVAFIFTFFVLYSYGSAIQESIKRFEEVPQSLVYINTLLGLAGITTIAGYTSLFYRINWEFHLFVILGALFFFVKLRLYDRVAKAIKNNNKFFSYGLIISALAAVIILHSTSLPPSNADTGIYHAQGIRWVEEYPAVPGLANLHARLGFNSSWLVTNAVFSFPYMGSSFHYMTGFLLLIASLYFQSGFQNIATSNGTLSDYLKAIFFVSLFILLLDQSSSPGTDAPATVLTWVLTTETVNYFERKPGKHYIFIIAILSAYTLTIKLSAIPLFLIFIPLLVELSSSKNKRGIGALITIGSLILAQHILRSIILTGYMAFPGPVIDPFNFDWKVPPQEIQNQIENIRWFATAPRMERHEFLMQAPSQWIPAWFDNLLPRFKVIIIGVILLPALMLSIIVTANGRKFLEKTRYVLWLYAVCYAGCLFWFISAPNIRFGLGFIIGAIAVNLSLFACYVVAQLPKPVLTSARPVVLILTLVLTLFMSRSSIMFKEAASFAILPADYPTWSSQPCQFQNFSLFCQVRYNACWYSPFPCAIKGNPDVELRGTDFRQGFRYNPDH